MEKTKHKKNFSTGAGRDGPDSGQAGSGGFPVDARAKSPGYGFASHCVISVNSSL